MFDFIRNPEDLFSRPGEQDIFLDILESFALESNLVNLVNS